MPDVNRHADAIALDDAGMIGDRIKRLREAKQMSQPRLAKLAGIAQASLSQIESNITKSLKGATLMRIAAALDEDPEYIRTGRRAARKPPDISMAESDVLDLYRRLSIDDRQRWIAIGESLSPRAENISEIARNLQHNVGTLATGQTASGAQVNRSVLEIVAQIADILERYGPDTAARVLADLKSAATTLAALPADPAGRKSKA